MTLQVERLRLDGLDLNIPAEGVPNYTNLVTNPSFEEGTAGWSAAAGAFLVSGATLDTVTTQQQFGTSAGRIVTTSAAASQGARYLFSGTFLAGVAYTASVYVKANVDVAIQVLFANGTPAEGTTVEATALASGWTRVTATYTPTVNRSDVRLVVRTKNADARIIYVDGAMAVEGSSTPAYFDGDTAGYMWSGVAHASTSIPNPPFVLEEFAFNPAKKLWEWVKGADSHGSRLLRPPLHENAELDLTIRVEPQSNMDDALDHVAVFGHKLQEAERVAAGGEGRGLELVYTPHDSTYSYTLYVQGGEIEEIPRSHESGWLIGQSPLLKAKLYCHPFGYGDEVTGSVVASSDPLLTLTVQDVPGDVPAEARLTATDTASKSRSFVFAGLEQRDYNASTSLIVDSDSLVTTGYAGAGATRTGAYDPNASGDNVVRATVATNPQVVCATADLTHIGAFHVVARVYATSADTNVRLAWRQGRNQWTTNTYVVVPQAGKFCEVNLGLVSIREVALGTQTWQGRIEAKCATATTTLDVDYLLLIPAELVIGKVRHSPLFETPQVFSALDQFNQSAGALTGKSADIGGAWAGVGDADDFTVNTNNDWVERTSVSDSGPIFGRYAISGAAAMTAQTVHIDFWHEKLDSGAPGSAVIVRYTDTSNYAYAVLSHEAGSKALGSLLVFKVVAGTAATLGSAFHLSLTKQSWYSLRLQVDIDGRWVMWYGPRDNPTHRISGQDSDLATGGALASGKPGFGDFNSTSVATTRRYDNFQAFVPVSDAAIFSGQSCEFRSHGEDVFLREDATGTYWGRGYTEARGGRFWLPPAGDDDRVSRIAVMARRNDIETLPSENIADGLETQVRYRPRWIDPPTQA